MSRIDYYEQDGEKKAYAEIVVEDLTEEQELALKIVLHEGALRERERIINVLEEHGREFHYDPKHTIALIEESAKKHDSR